jgi:hypothetical protein
MFQDENEKIWKLLNGRYEKVVLERSKLSFDSFSVSTIIKTSSRKYRTNEIKFCEIWIERDDR